MADVPQELLDWLEQARKSGGPATEDTLQRVADALGAKKGPGTGRSGASKATRDQQKATERTTDSFEELSKAADDVGDKFKETGEELKRGGRDAARATGRLADSADGMRDIFDSLGQTTTNIMERFGKVGRAAGGAIGGLVSLGSFAVGAAIKTQESFNIAAQAGANFGGSLLELKKASDAAGVPLETFSEVIKNNAANLSLFSGTVTKGARDMGSLVQAVRGQGLDRSLMSMGIALKDQPEFLAQFMGNMSRFGTNLDDFGGSFDAMARTAVGFRKELEIAKNITGETNDEQQAALDAAAKDAQLQARLRQEGGDAARQYQELMMQVPEGLRPVLRDLKLFGTVTEDSAGAAAMFPKQVELMTQALNQTDPAQAFRGLVEQNAGALQQELSASLDAIAVSGKSGSKALGQAAEAFVGYQQYIDRVLSGAIGAAEEQADEAVDTTTTPDELTKAMFQLQEAVNDTKKAFESLGTTMLLDGGATTIMDGFASGITEAAEAVPKLIKSITGFGDKFLGVDPSTMLFGAASAVGIATALAPMIVGALTTAAAMVMARRGRGFPVGGSGRTGTTGTSGPRSGGSVPRAGGTGAKWLDKLKGLGKGASKFLKGAAPFAAILGALELGSVLADDTLSKQEKFEQGGGAVGGAGGAMAGAAAGAALGSVVPGIGTLLGGLAGGAAGYFGGSELGKGIGDWLGGLFNDGTTGTTAPTTQQRGGRGGAAARPQGAPSAGPSTPQSATPTTAPSAAATAQEDDRPLNPIEQITAAQKEQLELLRELLKAVKSGSSNEVDALTKIFNNL